MGSTEMLPGCLICASGRDSHFQAHYLHDFSSKVMNVPASLNLVCEPPTFKIDISIQWINAAVVSCAQAYNAVL